MNDIAELIPELFSKNNTQAYNALKILVEMSQNSNAVYSQIELFLTMIDDKNSYIRNRGFVLVSANAKWDINNKINKQINVYLKHITDEKPISARNCIKSLTQLVLEKPKLKEVVVQALKSADTTKYNDSMQPLIEKDIIDVLEKIKDC